MKSTRMMKVLALVLALTVVLGSTMAFAAPYDLVHKDDAEKNYTFTEFADSPSVFTEVLSDVENYLIEAENGNLYYVSEVDAATADGTSFNDAVEGLDPYVEEEPVVAEELEFVTWNYVDGDTQANIIVRQQYSDGSYEDMEYPVVDEWSDAGEGWNYHSMDINGQRVWALDLIPGDDVELDFAAGNVNKVTVVEVENKDHMTVEMDISGDALTECAVEPDVWFSNTTDVALTVSALDDDFGTEIDFVTLYHGDDSTTKSGMGNPGWDTVAGFNPFTTEGTFEVAASATNMSRWDDPEMEDPVTKMADEIYTVVIDMTAPEIEVSYPTTSTSVELNAGDTFTADGTYDELNGFKEFTARVRKPAAAPGDYWTTEEETVTVNEDGTWNVDFDLSVVDFNDNSTASAVLLVSAVDCAGNESGTETVEFELKDETAPKVVEITEAGQDWVKVTLEENFALKDQVTAGAFTVTVNNVDYMVDAMAYDFTEEEPFVVLWIDEPTIEENYDVTVRYAPAGLLDDEKIMDTAGNEAAPKVTPIFNNGLTEEPPLEKPVQ